MSQEAKTLTPRYRTKLRENLMDSFSDEDLRTLCFDMKVDYEALPAQGTAGKVRELIADIERKGRIPELVEFCRKSRPSISWGNTTEETTTSLNGQPEPSHKTLTITISVSLVLS